MPTTPVQGLPYPALSDPANGPVAIQNLALGLEDYKTLVRCTSTTRPGHVEGRMIYETNTDKLLVSNGSSWRELGFVDAAPIVRTGTVSTNTDSLGRSTVTFASPFPSVCYAVMVEQFGTYNAPFGPVGPFMVEARSVTSFSYKCSAANLAGLQVSYIATGN